MDPDTGYTPQQLALISKEIFAAAEQQMAKVSAAATQAGIQAETAMLGGNPYEAIVEAAVKRESDLVVIGSHGRTGLQKLIMGSVAERVVALSPSAVLVVKRSDP
jgi:nucleotide-binding universal stress UspA family protein